MSSVGCVTNEWVPELSCRMRWARRRRKEGREGDTGQVLAPAWPAAGGRHWVKALDVEGPGPWWCLGSGGSDVALRDSLCC